MGKKVQNEHHKSYGSMFERPVQQISTVEGTISEIQRSTGVELSSLRQKSEKLQFRIEELEGELSHLHSKLAATEKEVQQGTTRVNLARTNHRTAREQLEHERNRKNEELQQVQRSIAQKSDLLHSMTRTGEEERKRMLFELDEAKVAKARQFAASDQRLQRLRSEYSVALEDSKRGDLDRQPTGTLTVG